jgi:uncharacterized cupin superfamily protein
MATVTNSPLLKATEIASLDERHHVHPLNPKAIRHTRSLGDAVGLQRLGIHLVRIAPGDETTQFHFHHHEEEFIYILSGRGIAELGDSNVEVGPGDFMGFTAPSVPHSLCNPFDIELVYLMGGERQEFDVCDYPHLQKRLIRMGENRRLVDWQQLKPFALDPSPED